MRLAVCLSLLLLAGCRRPKPSAEYTEASGSYTTLLAKMRRLGISRPVHQEETDVLALAPAGIRREDAHL